MKVIKKTKKGVPPISTASLPDIIFMLLFFFMVTTVMKTQALPEGVVIPSVERTEKIKVEEPISIYITNDQHDAINIMGKYVAIDDLESHLLHLTNHLSKEEVAKSEVKIYADQNVGMRILYDTKLILRKVNLRNIQYMATPIIVN